MKLYETLEKQLKKEPSFVTEGKLKKWLVINKAQNLDEGLIELLLDDPQLKDRFFIKLKNTLVFDQNLFGQFLEQKNYLNDSYTQYKNKLGLTINGEYLKQLNEVTLVWPFKDCVLEGGQSREEDKREEVFFNETLAQDEITQLLEPKVLTNAKRIDQNGEKPLSNFKRNKEGTITDNLIIKGNNLLALHTLKKEFARKIKLIYIDPPYNTGNDGFNYNDSFNKSTWLTFMKNRFDVAKDLLSKDGAIFVQCDDNEQSNLKVLMDEIFGRENHRETIVVKTSTPSGVNAVNVRRGERLFKVKEYLLFYSKNPDYRFKSLYIKSSFNKNYRYEVIKTKKGYQVTDLKQKFRDGKELENYALKNFTHIYSLEKNNKKAGEKIKKAIKASKENKTVIEFTNSKGELVLIYDGGVFIPLKNRIVSEGNRNYFGTLISAGISKDWKGAPKPAKYQRYSDFTIRYRRDGNRHTSRKESEYYKMKANYFVYGITNCSKSNTSQCTDFIKYAVIDLGKIYEKINEELILISDNKGNFCKIENDKIICPIKYNKDGSSSFFPIEIGFLVQLWGREIIIAQKGFL